MHLRTGWILVASLACWTGAAASASAAEPAPAWRFHEPIVLETTERAAANEDEGGPAADRLRLVALEDRFVLAVIPPVNTPKEARSVTLWSETTPGAWAKLVTVPGVVGTPTFLPLGRNHLALIALSREDKDKPRLWRISTAGEVTHSPIPLAAVPGGATPAERRRRDRLVVRLGTAASQGDSLGVFLLRGRQHGDTQEILCVRSDDLGKTWQAERSCGSIGYYEGDESMIGLVGFGDGARSFGLMAPDIKDTDDGVINWKPVLFASPDRQTAWRKDKLAWEDGLQPQTLRVPVAASRTPTGLVAVYGAFDAGGDQVRYCLTKSEDQGKTWSKGEPVTRGVAVTNMEHRVGLAASAGHVAMTYTEQTAETEGVGRLLVSKDHGATFEETPLERFYRGMIVEAPALASCGGPFAEPRVRDTTSGLERRSEQNQHRIVMASQILLDPATDRRCFLVVQEYSGRVSLEDAPLGGAALREVHRLVEQLGADDFETRQRAGRQLGTLGRSAKTQLLEAMRSSPDAEVRTRLRLILGKLYPPCLRVN